MSTQQASDSSGMGSAVEKILESIPDGSTIPDQAWEKRHKYFIITVLSHIPILLALGRLEGSESVVTGATFPTIPLGMLLLEVGIIAGLALAAAIPQLNRRVRTVLAVTGLAVCSGTLVHVTGGYIEAHFHFFVAVGIAAIYEDWLPFGVGIGYVVVTHGVFGMIDPSRVYNHAAAQMNPWAWSLIHAGFVAALAIALTVHLSSIERSRRTAQSELRRARERANRIDDLEQRQTEIEDKKQEAERLKAETEALNSQLQQKARRYQQAMEQAADGDLTVRVDPESETEAMVAIGTAFNDMMTDIETTVADIQSFAGDVEGRAQDVDSKTRQAATASEEVSESVREIAARADDQREMLEEGTGEMADLSATIEEVAASAQEVAEASQKTADVAADGQGLASEMIADAERVRASIESASETVAALEDQMATVAEITDLIAGIADQTNMLALNASIEAARAGGDGASETGDGFDVVATEVKQLAEETRSSTDDIQAQIAETQDKTKEVVAEVSQASELMEKEIDAVTEVAEAFEQVAANAEQTDNGVQEISEATDDQAASSEEVVSMVDEVTAISAESASESERVAATVEEQAVSMNDMSETASLIAGQANDLTELLATFAVESAQRESVMAQTVSSSVDVDK